MTGIVDNYRTIDNNRKILTFTFYLRSTEFVVKYVYQIIMKYNRKKVMAKVYVFFKCPSYTQKFVFIHKSNLLIRERKDFIRKIYAFISKNLIK